MACREFRDHGNGEKTTVEVCASIAEHGVFGAEMAVHTLSKQSIIIYGNYMGSSIVSRQFLFNAKSSVSETPIDPAPF